MGSQMSNLHQSCILLYQNVQYQYSILYEKCLQLMPYKCQSKFILQLCIQIELTNAGSRLAVSLRTILIFVTFYNEIEKYNKKKIIPSLIFRSRDIFYNVNLFSILLALSKFPLKVQGSNSLPKVPGPPGEPDPPDPMRENAIATLLLFFIGEFGIIFFDS